MNKIRELLKKGHLVVSVVFRNYIRVTKLLWKNDKSVLMLSYIRSVVNSIVPIINAFIYGEVVNILISGVIKKHNIELPIFILFIIWFVIYFISTYLDTLNYIVWQKTQLLLNKLYTALFLEKLNSVGIKTLHDEKFYDYFNKAQERYEYASGQVAHTSLRLNTALLSFIFSLLAFFYFSPLVSLIIIIALIPYIIYEINFSKISWGIWSESTDYRDHYFSVVEIFRRDNAQELKIHKSGEYLKNKVTTLNDERYKREMDLTKKRSRFNIFGSFIDTVIYVLSSLYIVYKALIGVIPIGSVVTFFSILANYISSVQFLTGSFIELYELGLFLDDIHNYLDFKLDDEMVNGEIKIKDNKQHKIEFKNVYFKYPKSKRYIFKNLSLTINPGEKIAIVGDNGAGKTTFINLLCRFYTANKGEILIDGVNINDIDILSWYDNLGVLFQDYIKYRFSVNENIRLGDIFKKNSDQNDIIEAAKKAQAHVFIEKFKDQYDTVLSRKGQGTISGGEWQKLALSREFFRDPTILILDEPTSNLDVKSEDNIFRIIEDTSKDKTVILISHRFSTVRNVDRIFVFEKGEILEEGSHQDLMNLKGKYFTLFNIQAKGYK